MILQFIRSEKVHVCDGKRAHMPRITSPYMFCIKLLTWPPVRRQQEP